MEDKGYLASDLAVELALPRSTINDWLTRYGDYLESESRGRRKVYSAKSLAVLREVAELRAKGAGSFEVEQTLAARHGLRPEVTSSAAPEASASPKIERKAAETLPSAPPVAVSAPPALLPDKELTRFAAVLEELAADRRRTARRVWTVLGVTLLALAAFAAAAVWLSMTLLSDMESAKRETAGTLREESAATGKRIDSISAKLVSSEHDFAAAVGDIKGELAAQRKAFAAELAAQRDSAKAELMRERNDFAARRIAELKQLEARHQAEKARLEAERAAACRDLEAARREIAAKKAELAAAATAKTLEKPISAASVPAKPVVAPAVKQESKK